MVDMKAAMEIERRLNNLEIGFTNIADRLEALEEKRNEKESDEPIE